MRNAELASHQVFERTWRFRSRGSMLVSVSIHPLTQGRLLVAQAQEALGVVDEPLAGRLLRGPRLEARQSDQPSCARPLGLISGRSVCMVWYFGATRSNPHAQPAAASRVKSLILLSPGRVECAV